ncbi:MAG TPA: DUF1573 domain-containing protein [Candidatus Acidoferrales bacterium]|nr:DUF1573 domain-containing protein [Candidatus Acidoferrales bacterium]
MTRKLSVLLLTVFLAAEVYGQPRISVAGNSTIDLGTVYKTGSHIFHTFEIKNDGDKVLHINGVRPGCGCTVAFLSDSTVKPGQKSEIKVDFNPSEYSGEVSKDIYVVSNDPANHMMTLRLKMNIAYVLQAKPDFILFRNAVVGQADTMSLTLTNVSDETVKITGVETDRDELSFHFDNSTIKPGAIARIELYLLAKKGGTIPGEIIIKTTSKHQPTVPVKYFAGINGK